MLLKQEKVKKNCNYNFNNTAWHLYECEKQKSIPNVETLHFKVNT